MKKGVDRSRFDTYHNIYLVMPDVFDMGGHTVFSTFERSNEAATRKNLLVVPKPLQTTLQDYYRKGSEAADAALQKLATLMKPSTVHVGKNETIVNASQTLDILLTDTLSTEHFVLERLFDSNYIKNNPFMNRNKLQFITRNHGQTVTIRSRGFIADKPWDLIADPDIERKGIVVGSEKLFDQLAKSSTNCIPLQDAIEILDGMQLYPNQFIRTIADETGFSQYAQVTGRILRNKSGHISHENPIVQLLATNEIHGRTIRVGKFSHHGSVFGIRPFDPEQFLALQYGLFDPNIEVFFINGRAGSGKTVMAYIAALDQILHYDFDNACLRKPGIAPNKQDSYSLFQQAVLIKAMNIVGGKDREVGFLPGDLLRKLKDHLKPYVHAHKESELNKHFAFEDLFLHPLRANEYGEKREQVEFSYAGKNVKLPTDREAVELVHTGFIRGYSLSDTYVVVDEAQNLTPFEMKTIIQRGAMGSKIIVLGDSNQIDNPKCSRDCNGLTWAIKHYLPQPFTGLVSLSRSYRNQAAAFADGIPVFNSGY